MGSCGDTELGVLFSNCVVILTHEEKVVFGDDDEEEDEEEVKMKVKESESGKK